MRVPRTPASQFGFGSRPVRVVLLREAGYSGERLARRGSATGQRLTVFWLKANPAKAITCATPPPRWSGELTV
ncbi:MAG: hypothetical protein ACRDRZ_03400 [Pseudonocardiaceae bacterium]